MGFANPNHKNPFEKRIYALLYTVRDYIPIGNEATGFWLLVRFLKSPLAPLL